MAKMPPGFQNGILKRHKNITDKNGNNVRKDFIMFSFICIPKVYQILIQLHATSDPVVIHQHRLSFSFFQQKYQTVKHH